MNGTNLLNDSSTSFIPPSLSTATTEGFATIEPPFEGAGLIILAVIIFTLLVVGALANLLTIMVIVTYKELNKNVFMRFILSLCVSDLTSALISWLFLYRRTWGFDDFSPLPDFMCKLYWAVDIMTSYVTALHILSFSILRFMSIQFPLSYKKIKLLQGNIWMGAIWFLCFCGAFIPGFFIFAASVKDRRSDTPFSRWPACTASTDRYNEYVLYQKIGYTLFFYGPAIGVVLMCTVVVILVASRSRKSVVSQREEKRKLKERKAVIQLFLIILSFLLGYIPFTAYEFWSVEMHPNEAYYRKVDSWFGMIGYIFLRFSECLNPLFYNLGFPKVYTHTKQFISTKLIYRSLVSKKSSPPPLDGVENKISTISSENSQKTKV